MENFLTLSNLLEVSKILKKYYPDYHIYVGLDKFGVNILKFVHNFKNCDFEIILVNNFDCKLNKRWQQKVNMRRFNSLFRQAMASVCGQKYAEALKNYEKYEKPINLC